jgi:hypothetical protein
VTTACLFADRNSSCRWPDRVTCSLRSYLIAPLWPCRHSLSPWRRRFRWSRCCPLRLGPSISVCAHGVNRLHPAAHFTRVRPTRNRSPADRVHSHGAFRPVDRSSRCGDEAPRQLDDGADADRHVRVTTFADLIDGALAHIPPGRFAANSAISRRSSV